MYSPSQTPAIHSYHVRFPPLAWHPKLFSLSSPSRYQSLSSSACSLSDTSTLSYIDPLRNPVILHSFHIPKRYENTFITSHNYVISVFRTLSILLIPCKPLKSSICIAQILDLSFSLHIIISLSYVKTGTNNDSCKTLAHSSCKLLALNRALIVPATLLSLATFLLHSASLPHMYPIHPKHIPSI